MTVQIREIRPADYRLVISVVDDWWGIRPDERGSGLGRQLYERFFAAVRERGCGLVRSVTSPVNTGSVRFHRRVGFEVEPGDKEVNGIQVAADYDGDGNDRVRFVKRLAAPA